MVDTIESLHNQIETLVTTLRDVIIVAQGHYEGHKDCGPECYDRKVLMNARKLVERYEE